MAFKQLSDLRTLVRRKADIENDGNHITDAELTSYINTSIEHLFSFLVDGTDGSFFAKNATNPPKLGANSFQLPSDFGQLVSVQVKKRGHYIESIEADPEAYAALALLDKDGADFAPQHYLKWNVGLGRAEVFVFPSPESTDLHVRYVPAPPTLSLDTDTLNLPTFWYQWVVLDAAVYCLLKEESDPSGLMAERQRVERRIRDHIRSMTVTQFKTIRNARWGRGWGWA